MNNVRVRLHDRVMLSRTAFLSPAVHLSAACEDLSDDPTSGTQRLRHHQSPPQFSPLETGDLELITQLAGSSVSGNVYFPGSSVDHGLF